MRNDLYEINSLYDLPRGETLVQREEVKKSAREVRLMLQLNQAVGRLFKSQSYVLEPRQVQRDDSSKEALGIIKNHPDQPTTYYMDFQVVEDEEGLLYLGLFFRLEILIWTAGHSNEIRIVALNSAQSAEVAKRLRRNPLFMKRLQAFLRDKTHQLRETSEKIAQQLDQVMLFAEEPSINRIFWHRDWKRAERREKRRLEVLATPGLAGTLLTSIDELELTVRAYNCMLNANIHTVRDLVLHTEEELLKVKHFGRKTLAEVKELVSNMGLELGTEFKEKADEKIP